MEISNSQQERGEKLLEFAAKFRALVEEYGVIVGFRALVENHGVIVNQNMDGELLVLHPISELAQEGGLSFLYPPELRPEAEPEVLLATTNGIDEMIWPEPPAPVEVDPFVDLSAVESGPPCEGGF